MSKRTHETQLAYHRRRATELAKFRQPIESDWRDLAAFIDPQRVRMEVKDQWRVDRSKIIDSTATFALKTLASGMHSGLTSPARPWFRLTTFDPAMKDYGPVKTWIAQVERRLREVFQGSNLYNAFHMGYGDLGLLGQSCAILVEDENDVIRLQQLVHGTFWLARDHTGRATTLYRKFRWTVARIVSRFGYDTVKLLSPTIATHYDNAQYEETFDIWHAIEPRFDRNPKSMAKHDKPFLSNYWLESGAAPAGHSGLLEESGFDENPIIAPAWELVGEDTYGNSPGMVAIGDVKMLQMEQKRKLEGIDKIVRPPMKGPLSMMNNPASVLPGHITYVDATDAAGFTPVFEVNLRLAELLGDIRETQDRIRQAFYADLFLMISNMEGIQPRNQFEIAERKEEKLLALGPVLENVYNGMLEPVIDRTFNILNRRGELPPPPPELEGEELKIEYISMLAQAQQAVSTGSIERGVAFAGQLAAANPEVLDKVDMDEAVDVYFDMLGVPPSIVVPDDKVQEKRQARQQQMQMAQQAEMAAQMAPAAKQGAEAMQVMTEAASLPAGGDLLSRLGIG